MKKQKRFYFFPKTRIGKISFWLVIFGFLMIIFLNIIAGLMQRNDICDENGICKPAPKSVEENQIFILVTRVIPGLLAIGCILIAGIISIISIIKYRDYAIFLFLSSLIGILGILFVIGEFTVPH
jgi:uncharacterized membrane protein YhaH (DUF805 family)